MKQQVSKNLEDYFLQTDYIELSSKRLEKENKGLSIFFNLIIFGIRISLALMTWVIIIEDQNDLYGFSNLLQQFRGALYYQMAYFSILFLKIVILFTVFCGYRLKHNLVFRKWSNFAFSMLSEYKEIDLTASGFLLCIDWMQNIIPFFLSLLLEANDTFLVQNYISRKSSNYIKDRSSYYFYRFIVVLFFCINALNMQLQSIFIFESTFLSLSLVYFFWYFSVGKTVFKNEYFDQFIILQVSTFVVISYQTIEDIITNTSGLSTSMALECIIITVVFNIFCFLRKNKEKENLFDQQSLNSKNMKQYDLTVTQIIEKNNQSSQLYILLLGKLAYIEVITSAPQIMSRQNDQQGLMTRKDKDKKAKDHVQQCYEQSINRIDFQKNIAFQYCEFLFNENRSMHRLITLLSMLQHKNLNIVEMATVYKYRYLISQTFKKMNSDLYEGKLRFDHIIECEEHVDYLHRAIGVYLKSYRSVWDHFGESQVDTELVRQQLAKQAKMMEHIDKQWGQISQLLQDNLYWKRIYFNFLLFIKNEKIKQKVMDELRYFDLNKQALKLQPNGNNTSAKKQAFNPAILFGKDVAFLKAVYQDKELFIKKASQNFKTSTKFRRFEVTGCKVDVLIPKQMREKHRKAVNEWIDGNQLVVEEKYQMRDVEVLNKSGRIKKAIKMYKTCFSIEEGLTFICFLKFQDNPNDLVSSQKNLCQNFSAILSQEVSAISTLISDNPSGFSETLESNIFLKEQALDSPKESIQIIKFNFLSRIQRCKSLALLIASFVILNINSEELVNHSDQFINFMSIYRYPIVLNLNYMRSILNMGNQTTVAANINLNTNNFIAAASNQLTIKSLYDTNLNIPKTYSAHSDYSQFANTTFNQLDLFYAIISSVSSLNNLPINGSGSTYRFFSAFIKPAYSQMINGTKFRLHETFSNVIKYTGKTQFYVLVSEAGAFILMMALMLAQMNRLFKQRNSIILTIKDFYEDYRQVVNDYYRSVRIHFRMLFKGYYRSKPHVTAQQKMVEQIQQDMNGTKVQNLNKKQGKLTSSKQGCSFYCSVRIVFILTELFVVVLFLSMITYNFIKVNSLDQFQMAGFTFLKYYPTAPILTMGILEKYYSIVRPNEKLFEPSKYDDALASTYIFGNYEYTGSVDPTSPFFTKKKNYFFANPCTYNPTLVRASGLNVETCLKVANGSLALGVSSYLRSLQIIGEKYLRNKINLTTAEVNECVLSLSYQTIFVLDAIATWIDEFATRTKDLENGARIFTITFVLVVIVVHIIFSEILLDYLLKKQYSIILHIYRFLVPQLILQKDKITRQKFAMQGVIKK